MPGSPGSSRATAPSASVVVVNFEYARYLREAVESALGQTHPDVEVVVVDDGSRDGSRELIAGFGAGVVPVLKGNGGQASAMNAGWRACRGEVVCFLDADDALEPAAMAAAAEALADPGAVKVHWPLVEVDEEGRPLGTRNPPARLEAGDLREKVLARGPGAYVTAPTSGNAYARAYLEQVMPVPEDIVMCADAWLYDLAPLYGRVARVEAPQGRYRKHASYFGGRGLDERLARAVALHERLIPVLAARARSLGLPGDEARWRAASWPLRQQAALAEIAAVVPPGSAFALLDDGRLEIDPTAERRPLPFRADGDGGAAVAELDRLRAAGARFLVIAWPAFPWLARARGFAGHLRHAHRVLVENERLLVFALA
jgi:voltage-gated potassium channel Kch